MKYFYAIALDGYSYALVTEERFDNMTDYLYKNLATRWVFDELGDRDGDIWAYLERIDNYPTGEYVALDEDNNPLKDLCSNEETFKAITGGGAEILRDRLERLEKDYSTLYKKYQSLVNTLKK